MITQKQLTYLSDLIWQHPNFKRTFLHDDLFIDENKEKWLRRDGQKMMTFDEAASQWISDKYYERMDNRVNSLKELDVELASAIITHLKLSADERRSK